MEQVRILASIELMKRVPSHPIETSRLHIKNIWELPDSEIVQYCFGNGFLKFMSSLQEQTSL